MRPLYKHLKGQYAEDKPNESSSSEIALPMPVAPPVTMATFPAKSPGRNTDIFMIVNEDDPDDEHNISTKVWGKS